MPSLHGSTESTLNSQIQSSRAQREARAFTAILGSVLTLSGAAIAYVGLLTAPAVVTLILMAVLVLCVGSITVIRSLPTAHRHPNGYGGPYANYGTANRLTQIRLAMSALLSGLVLETAFGAVTNDSLLLQWLVIGLVILAASLDALDGPLARRQGLVSPLGARFDMEVDAFFILILSLMCWQWGKAGAWIVLAGAMRYAFIGAAWRWPWLAATLPPSTRRQTICVIQIISLIIVLLPIIAVPWSSAAGALGLALLTVSFVTDIRWLASAATHRLSL